MPIFILLFLLTSCSSIKANKDYIQSSEYESREALQQSFFKEKDQDLTESEIASLLNKKVELKEKIKMAIVYKSPRSFFSVTKEKEKIFSARQKKESKVQDLQFVPNLLLPKTQNLKKVREIAALMQADLLLIIESQDLSNFKYHLLSKNETKANVSLEAIVMDVRTGAIPYSSRATAEALIESTDADFSRDEFIYKAILQAEDSALTEIMENIDHYFN